MSFSKTHLIDRAAKEAAAGRLWRAKEILAGSIGSHGYTPERFAAYGRLLARMQDTKEAGKYLFLSGLATVDEVPAVEVFLASVRGRPRQWIYAQFPGAARRGPLVAYPDRVREELRRLGFPDDFRWKGPPETPTTTNRWQSVGAVAVGFSILGLICLGLLHGCYVASDWVFGK